MPTFPIPLGDDCIIHPFEYPAKIGGLYVPDPSKKRVNQGIIIAKGPLVSGDLETSDHVFFNGYTGDKLVFEDGGEFFVIPEQHIICKVRRSKVVIMDTVTVKRIIQERMGELVTSSSLYITNNREQELVLEGIEHDLLNRIDSFSIQGWEF